MNSHHHTDGEYPDSSSLLSEVLEICEDYLRHADTTTRADIDTLLLARGITGGPGWLIDMLALSRLRLPPKVPT